MLYQGSKDGDVRAVGGTLRQGEKPSTRTEQAVATFLQLLRPFLFADNVPEVQSARCCNLGDFAVLAHAHAQKSLLHRCLQIMATGHSGIPPIAQCEGNNQMLKCFSCPFYAPS